MFGYVGMFVPDMKVRDHTNFKACYCGLCKTLKHECSEHCRLLLNYDCAFLYVLAAACAGKPPKVTFERCVVSPFKKKPVAIGEGADYAAAVNVLLGVGKLRDDAADKNRLLYGSAAGIYARAYKKAAMRYPEVEHIIREGLERLSSIEAEKKPDIDTPADAFAVILAGLFEGAGENKAALRAMGYNIGRWIYLIDALDDIVQDEKRGGYNPLLLRYGRECKDEAAFTLNASIAAAIDAYEKLDIVLYKPILDNIMYIGLYHKTQMIINGKKGCGAAPQRESNGSI